MATLNSYLLVPITSVAPDLSEGELIAVRAYLVLSHAAIEEFIEAAFLTYVRECTLADDRGRVHPGTTLALLRLADEIRGQIPKAQLRPAEILSRIPPLYQLNVLRPNHGIKPDYIQTMALGAGLGWPEFEAACPNLLAALPTLSSARGDIAHLSSLGLSADGAGLRITYYPEDARKKTGAVLTSIQEFIDHLASTLPPFPAQAKASGNGLIRGLARRIRVR